MDKYIYRIGTIPEYPTETHCLHITTPTQHVEFCINLGDIGVWMALLDLCHQDLYAVPVHRPWLTYMANLLRRPVPGEADLENP